MKPATGHVASFVEPSEPFNKDATASLPSPENRMRIISSSAATPGNKVAIAEITASQVDIAARAGKVIAEIKLPQGTSAGNLAAESNSTLAVPLLNYSRQHADSDVLFRKATGQTKLVRSGTTFVTAGKAPEFLAGGRGPQGLSRISADDGDVSTVAFPPAPTTGPYRALVGEPTYPLPDGQIAYGTGSGIAVESASGATAEFVLPSYQCSDVSDPQESSTVPLSENCAAFPVLMSVDGDGNIWFQVSGPGDAVGEISTSVYESTNPPSGSGTGTTTTPIAATGTTATAATVTSTVTTATQTSTTVTATGTTPPTTTSGAGQ